MIKSIRLTITSPDHTVGPIDGFQFFWAWYVDGYRSDRHCQHCFLGAPIPEFSTSTARTGTPVQLDRIGRHKYVYVCGVGVGPKHELCRKNFHLPLRYEEGQSVSAVTYNGYIVTANNAVLLLIPALPKDWSPLADGKVLADKFTRCRNFQFAVNYFGYPSPASP